MKCENSGNGHIPSGSEAFYISCGSCDRLNAVAARFCGGCGKALIARKIAMVSDRSAVGGVLPDNNSESVSGIPDEDAFFGSVVLAVSALRQWFKGIVSSSFRSAGAVKNLRPWLNRRRIRRIAAAGALGLSIVLSVMLKGAFTGPDVHVAWGDFRHHVSQKYVIAPQDLDLLFAEINAGKTRADVAVTPAQASMLETALRQRYGDTGIRLFPNPFFGNNGEGGEVIFADVPMDHPVYQALKPLLELGVNCADGNLRIRPYEPMAWSEWEKIVNQLFSLLGLGEESRIVTGRGNMTREDLRFAIAALRRQFYVGGIERLDGIRGTQSAGRLESLAALAMVLNDLNQTRP